MPFEVLIHQEFAPELDALDPDVQRGVASHMEALRREGHRLGRPAADTLSGSRFKNMKELRPTVNKVEWRVAFAFDAERRAILLAAEPKGGQKSTVVYGRLIAKADARFEAHQASLRPRKKKGKR
jgi:hypothetical protein